MSEDATEEIYQYASVVGTSLSEGIESATCKYELTSVFFLRSLAFTVLRITKFFFGAMMTKNRVIISKVKLACVNVMFRYKGGNVELMKWDDLPTSINFMLE